MTKNPSDEAELYFETLSKEKDAAEEAYRHIIHTVDIALKEQDYDLLFSLIPYIEQGEGELAYKYIGKTKRILRSLTIAMIEYRHQEPLFLSACSGFQEMMDAYMLALFSLRRILFQLSENSAEEAVQYLQAMPLSPFAVYIITQDDLFRPTPAFDQRLLHIYNQIWSESQRQLFQALLTSKTRYPDE